MTLFDEASPNHQGYRDVTPALVHASRAVKLVDVREVHEFNAELGHAAGTILVPLGSVPANVDDWNPTDEIVLICRSGVRSGQAAAWLASQGFTRAMNMTGGMIAWNAAGLPVARD